MFECSRPFGDFNDTYNLGDFIVKRCSLKRWCCAETDDRCVLWLLQRTCFVLSRIRTNGIGEKCWMASPFVRRQQEHATKAFAIGVGLLPGPGAEGWVLRGINRAAGSPRSKNAARIHSIFTDFRSCVCQFFNQPFGRWLLTDLGCGTRACANGSGCLLEGGKVARASAPRHAKQPRRGGAALNAAPTSRHPPGHPYVWDGSPRQDERVQRQPNRQRSPRFEQNHCMLNWVWDEML